jgi:hypothetical protein
MPWNPELVNTTLGIYRPDRGGPGGDLVGAVTLVAKGLPATLEERQDARRQDVPVISSEDTKKLKIWIEGIDNDGDLIDVRERDLVDWVDYLGNTISPRWEIEVVRPWMGPMAGAVPVLEHIVLEAKP